ncbi:MAG TPA: Panacea domain-containing protein [Fluviicola sp.]|nr:Panacea domain-containing protein [Fluviicola sp.]
MDNNLKMNIFNRSKIGNLFIYLSDHIDNLFLTKLLKLTYIIDELAVKETGSPVTWLRYKVWKMGPVANKIHANLTFEDGSFFSEYIDVEYIPEFKGRKIESNNQFDDSEFSDYEMELIDRVIRDYGRLSSSELIELLHENNSLWHQIVVEKNLQPIFDSEEESTSPYSIDLKDAITDPFLKKMFDEMLHNIEFRESLSN